MGLSDWEIWACAQKAIEQHGAKAPMHVADRLGSLTAAGDLCGVAAWQAIAAKVDQLMDYRNGIALSRQ
ncbi:DUF6961 family protein [Sphingomonas sp. VDB2]|uniref:DUF6961 family protein n=1 Tax=Sphingomonas sp. VDB2 TaxID=3228751 RepID=UPI003A8045A1